MPDLSAYGLSASTDGSGSFDFDTTGAIESHEPDFVKALENASEEVSGAAAGVVGGLATAAEVAAYVAPDVATALGSASGVLAGAAALTGPLAPVVGALIVALAVVESNLASGGTGCCGERRLSRQEAVQQIQFDHLSAQQQLGIGNPSALGGKTATIHSTFGTSTVNLYQPTDDEVRKRILYSGFGATASACNPAHYSWDVSWGAADDPGTNDKAYRFLISRAKGSPEAFIEGVLRAAWEERNGCWSSLDPKALPAFLAGALRAWNNTHWPTSKRTITVMPLDGVAFANPIIVAVDQLRAMAKTPEAIVRMTVNTGPFISGALTRGVRSLSPLKSRPVTTKGVQGVPMAVPYALGGSAGALGSFLQKVNPQPTTPANAALVSISKPPTPAAATGFFSKKLVGPVTVGEAGIGAIALGFVTKLLKVW